MALYTSKERAFLPCRPANALLGGSRSPIAGHPGAPELSPTSAGSTVPIVIIVALVSAIGIVVTAMITGVFAYLVARLNVAALDRRVVLDRRLSRAEGRYKDMLLLLRKVLNRVQLAALDPARLRAQDLESYQDSLEDALLNLRLAPEAAPIEEPFLRFYRRFTLLQLRLATDSRPFTSAEQAEAQQELEATYDQIEGTMAQQYWLLEDTLYGAGLLDLLTDTVGTRKARRTRRQVTKDLRASRQQASIDATALRALPSGDEQVEEEGTIS